MFRVRRNIDDEYFFEGKRVILYGTGGVSRILVDTVGICPYAFFDTRCNEIDEFLGRPVYDYSNKDLPDKDCIVVIITIRNVYEHDFIAEKLFRNGFRNVIYKPLSIVKGARVNCSKSILSINEAYEEIINKKVKPTRPIYTLSEECFSDIDPNAEIMIEDGDKDVKCFIHSELLFTNILEDSIWSELNIKTTYVLKDLYRAFVYKSEPEFSIGKKKYIERFALPSCMKVGMKVDGKWEERTIQTRLSVYYEMEKQISVNPEFFNDNAPRVEYKPKGRFVLASSGKNRIAFQIANGRLFVPVVMTKDDWNKYYNLKVVERIQLHLEKLQTNELAFPILHPAFFNHRVTAFDYIRVWGCAICEQISEKVYKKNNNYSFGKVRIGVFSKDDGTISRYLKMHGFCVSRFTESNSELCSLIDELFWFNPSDFAAEHDKYDAVIIDTRHMLGKMSIVSNCSASMIFALCNNESKYIIDSLEGQYGGTKCCFTSMWGGELVCGYFLEKTNKRED